MFETEQARTERSEGAKRWKKKVKKLVHNGKVHLVYPANLQALFPDT